MEDLPMKSQPAPQLSTAKRRLNQQGQPRTGEGKYANKPESKWKRAMSGQPATLPPLKKQSKPARPGTARQPLPHPIVKKRVEPLPSMAAMMDRPLHHKVGYVVRRWFRRKKQHFKALFSLRG